MTTVDIIEYTGDVFVQVPMEWADAEVENGMILPTSNPLVFLLNSPVYETRGITKADRVAATWDAKHATGIFAKVTGSTWDGCPILPVDCPDLGICENVS